MKTQFNLLNFNIMNALRKLFLAGLLLAFLGATAYASSPNPNSKLRSKIISLVKTADMTSLDQDEVATVEFTLNREGEIVVLSVDTENRYIENLLKTRLNYKKAKIEDFKPGKKYFVDLTFKKDA